MSSSTPFQAPRLHGKIAIVTGASSGLGRAICLAYAFHGTKLIVCADLQPEPRTGTEGETERTHDLINRTYGEGRAIFVKTDVGDAQSMENLVSEAVKKGGRLDM